MMPVSSEHTWHANTTCKHVYVLVCMHAFVHVCTHTFYMGHSPNNVHCTIVVFEVFSQCITLRLSLFSGATPSTAVGGSVLSFRLSICLSRNLIFSDSDAFAKTTTLKGYVIW